MAEPTTFEGWLGHDPSAAQGAMTWGSFTPKPWEETDIDIRITHCGICGTDIHMLRSGWGAVPYPLTVGHEIVGVAVRVGSAARPPIPIRVGDRVGVGAQADSCGRCDDCREGEESYCDGFVQTYSSFFHGSRAKSYGGFAKHARVPGRFVVKVPDGLESRDAAPMMCGGVTVFSPLCHFGDTTATGRPLGEALRGKKVGVVGIGGLGHFAVLFAKAMGAETIVGISRRGDKRADAFALGCDAYIATSEEQKWVRKHFRSLDLIISTVSSSSVPMKSYLLLLKRDGTLCQVGNPDDGDLTVPAGVLISKRLRLAGSMVSSPKQLAAMLEFAAEKGIRPWVEERPMSDANKAIVDMEAGKARYRYVLVNDTGRERL